MIKISKEVQLMALVSNEPLRKADVIVCLEGDGYNRIPQTAKLFTEKWAKLVVISGGYKNPPFSIPAQNLVKPLVNLGVPYQKIILEENSQNTKEQALEIMKLAKEKKWKKIILVASHFHQPRAYLTFLKAMKGIKMRIQIFNAPVRELSWFTKTPLGPRIKLLEEEFEKINKYIKKGQLATIKEVIKYQKWKERAK